MPERDSPLNRSIGLSGVLTLVIALAAVIALGAAISAGRYVMAAVAAAFLVVAAVLGFRARRARLSRSLVRGSVHPGIRCAFVDRAPGSP